MKDDRLHTTLHTTTEEYDGEVSTTVHASIADAYAKKTRLLKQFWEDREYGDSHGEYPGNDRAADIVSDAGLYVTVESHTIPLLPLVENAFIPGPEPDYGIVFDLLTSSASWEDIINQSTMLKGDSHSTETRFELHQVNLERFGDPGEEGEWWLAAAETLADFLKETAKKRRIPGQPGEYVSDSSVIGEIDLPDEGVAAIVRIDYSLDI